MSIDVKIIPEIGVELEPWRQVLIEAAQRLRTRGWAQGAMRQEDGRMCLIGAIFDANSASDIPLNNMETPEWQAVIKLDSHKINMRWNDDKDRTSEEVISALEACALQGISL